MCWVILQEDSQKSFFDNLDCWKLCQKSFKLSFIIFNVTNCQTASELCTFGLSRRLRAAEMTEWKRLGLVWNWTQHAISFTHMNFFRVEKELFCNISFCIEDAENTGVKILPRIQKLSTTNSFDLTNTLPFLIEDML